MNPSLYLQRCLRLAELGGTRVCPNPQVGAVVVYKDRIIGEGYHAVYGGPHAEVVAIGQVGDPEILRASTLYVSLEPCNHHGKTPPCTELILRSGIPKVVIGCMDPDPRVSGGGIARLRSQGVAVSLAPDPTPFMQLNRSFYVNQQLGRPYITLKWAQSAEGRIAGVDTAGNPRAVALTQFPANTLVHRLRFRHQAIMIGRRTAEIDNPRLTNRLFYGPQPIRVVLDRNLALPTGLKVLSDGLSPTLVPNALREKQVGKVHYWKLNPWPRLPELFQRMYREAGICSILVEGGSNLLQQLIDAGLYDEVFLLQSRKNLPQGKAAPVLPDGFSFDTQELLGEDLVMHRALRHFTLVDSKLS